MIGQHLISQNSDRINMKSTFKLQTMRQGHRHYHHLYLGVAGSSCRTFGVSVGVVGVSPCSHCFVQRAISFRLRVKAATRWNGSASRPLHFCRVEIIRDNSTIRSAGQPRRTRLGLVGLTALRQRRAINLRSSSSPQRQPSDDRLLDATLA